MAAHSSHQPRRRCPAPDPYPNPNPNPYPNPNLNPNPNQAGLLDTPTLLRWRALQERTVAWVVETVGDPPAGGDGPALRDFCAEAMARGYFRLPHFARAVLDALQSEDVLVHEPVPEWLRVSARVA